MERKEKELQKILFEINAKLECLSIYGIHEKWIPKKTVMRFFDYGETQMRELEKENQIITSKIKARKFYSVESILALLEKNIG
jgi:hypothetical protein